MSQQPEQNKTANDLLDKHIINRFDAIDRKTFLNAMEEYASQQTASLQKQVEELREENERLTGTLKATMKRYLEKNQRIAQLEDTLKSVRPYLASSGTNGNHWLLLIDKAINPQDK